jgi:UDP-3-O-[3-hydroxymyristoyl] glucosamine N-acyltransferase
VIIHANTTIGADAFYYKRTVEGYKKMHNAGNVVIKNNVEIGAGCTIDAGVSSETTIGEGTKIDDQVHIGHDVKIGQHCIIAGQVGIAGNTIVGNHVTLYGKVAVNKNITIGDNVTVYACSAIAKSLEPNKTYLGVPAEEARAMAKQFAMLRKLPDMWELFKKLNH